MEWLKMTIDYRDPEWSDLATELCGHRVDVWWVDSDQIPGAHGLAEYRKIYINRDSPRTKHSYILLHEIAHVMLGHAPDHTDRRYKTALHLHKQEYGDDIRWRTYTPAEKPRENAADKLTIQLCVKHQPSQLDNVRYYINERN